MFKRTSKPNQVSGINSFTNSHSKTRNLDKIDPEQINESLSNISIVKFCKESITQQNDINNKG